jgi:hypothetical protein
VKAPGNAPTVPLVESPDGLSAVSIMVKNTSNVVIKDAKIVIIGDRPFEVKTQGFVKFSDRQYRYEIERLQPFSVLGEMQFISAVIPKGVTLFIVTVHADNMTPYAAVGRVNLLSLAPSASDIPKPAPQ